MLKAALLIIPAVMLVLALAPAHAQVQAGGVDKEGSWHAGEGLEQGDYFHYSMCHFNYKQCANFEIELWIKGDVTVGSETKWLAEAVVYDGNKVIVGEIELGKIAPEPTGGSDELKVYRGAFKSSVVWLSAFATADVGTPGKGPKEFSAASWGKIANIGGEQILPTALETVRTPAGEWETVQISWKTGGVISRVWIVDEFPFPIKARTFIHVSEGIAPVEYEFELLKYEQGVQQSPFEGIESTALEIVNEACETGFKKDTVVKRPTAGFSYQIHAFYGPEEPVQGCPMQWNLSFISKFDDTEFLNQVQFDVVVFDDSGDDLVLLRSIANEEGRDFLYSPSGQYQLDMTVLEDPGDVTYRIIVYGLAPENWVPSERPDYLDITVPVISGDFGFEPTPVAPPAPQPATPTVQPATPPAAIPDWIKTNAGWWAEGLLDDDSFVSGIQFLISEGVLEIPPTTQGSPGSGGIPDWVKTNAGWWADGQLGDDTFVSGVQFLIKEGIISLP